MKLQKLTLKQFTVFDEAEFEFSPGINVILGANGTGKSHLLKILYSILKAQNEEKEGQNEVSSNTFDVKVRNKIKNVFRPDSGGLGRLVNRSRGRKTASIDLDTDKGQSKLRITTQNTIYCDSNSIENPVSAIFIPSREILSICYALRTAYETVELPFDETYYDLSKELIKPTLKGARGEKAGELVKPLELITGGKVFDESGTFYVRTMQGEIEAHLLAEGWRKIASLCRLILNGSLLKNSCLFWDEPEANLNAKHIKSLCDMLRRLAAEGVQIFVSTHDYLLSSELSLAVEYPKQQPTDLKCDMKFFTLNRNASAKIEVQTGANLAELKNNPILEEFAAHYDRETSLFNEGK